MMDIITGKTRPDEGEVFFSDTVDLTRRDEADIAQLGIGRKFQKPTVFESHTVWDNLELALNRKRGVFSTLFYRLSGADHDRIEEILETIRLTARRDELAANLSTARSNGWRSACCWHRSRNCCWSTNPSPA